MYDSDRNAPPLRITGPRRWTIETIGVLRITVDPMTNMAGVMHERSVRLSISRECLMSAQQLSGSPGGFSLRDLPGLAELCLPDHEDATQAVDIAIIERDRFADTQTWQRGQQEGRHDGCSRAVPKVFAIVFTAALYPRRCPALRSQRERWEWTWQRHSGRFSARFSPPSPSPAHPATSPRGPIHRTSSPPGKPSVGTTSLTTSPGRRARPPGFLLPRCPSSCRSASTTTFAPGSTPRRPVE